VLEHDIGSSAAAAATAATTEAATTTATEAAATAATESATAPHAQATATTPVRVAYPVQSAPAQALPAKPLRVVRVLEPSASRTVAGRMVISGRLADVCAELDRLAALEAR